MAILRIFCLSVYCLAYFLLNVDAKTEQDGLSRKSKGDSAKLGRRGALKSAIAGFMADSATNPNGYPPIGHVIGPHNSGGNFGGYYYWLGKRYYPGPSPDLITCDVQTPPDFNITYLDNNQRVPELIYECRKSQFCCDEVCCPPPFSVRAIVVIVLLFVIFIPSLVCSIWRCVRFFRVKQSYEEVQHGDNFDNRNIEAEYGNSSGRRQRHSSACNSTPWWPRPGQDNY